MTCCFKSVLLIVAGFGWLANGNVVKVGSGGWLGSVLGLVTKETIVGAVSRKCARDIGWFFENLENYTDDGMWALKKRDMLLRLAIDSPGTIQQLTIYWNLDGNQWFDTMQKEIQSIFVPALEPTLIPTYEVLDASAKIPSGILKLNLGDWMGSFDECLEIRSEKRNIKGNYCLGTLYITINDDSFQFLSESLTTKAKLFAEKKSNFQNAFPTASYPSFGICVPDGCTSEDLQKVVASLNLSFPLPFECQTIDKASPPLTIRAWCVIGFFVCIICLMTTSTIYDLNCRKTNVAPPHVLLNSFSVYTNGKKLFKTQRNTSELACLNGIRFISMIWVIIGHTLSVTITGPVINALDVLDYLDSTKSMIFVNAVHSVDTFLMVTGLLVVYGYMKSKRLGAGFNPIKFYLHRYIRLTPPFLAVILVSMSLLQYMGSGPHWSFIVNYFQGYCQDSWWSSLLYLQNYINIGHMCVGQTWYLNIDWQLYLCAPLFLLTLTWRPSIGISLLSLALIAFIATPFYVTWVNELPALISNLYGDLTNFQNQYYLLTHTRASPWFVGALYGYFITKYPTNNGTRNVTFNKYLMLGGWLISLAVICVCIFAGHTELRSQEYHKYNNAFYNSLVRPVWALSVGWIVLACTAGYGGIINVFLSLPIFQVLNRFTYSIYLLHVTMLYMIVYASKTPSYFSFFHIAYSFWGIAMLSFAVSIFWVLAFESPVIVIEKYFLTKSTVTAQTKAHQRNV